MTEGNAEETEHARAPRLKDAMRQARIEMAERSGVVVDLRDAELAARDLLIDAVSRRRRRRRVLLTLLIGLTLGVVRGAGAVLGTAWVSALR